MGLWKLLLVLHSKRVFVSFTSEGKERGLKSPLQSETHKHTLSEGHESLSNQ